MKEVTVGVPDGKRAEWVNGVLTLVDDVEEARKDDRPVTERIKTFDDALDELETKANAGDCKAALLVGDWDSLTSDSPDIIAYYKLRIIAAVLNEGWEPQFTTDEYRWFPWFRLYTKEEIDKMNDSSRVVRRSYSGAYASGGVACVGAISDSSSSYAIFGSRLAFKSEELADYAGNQFIEIWADFCFKPEEKE